MTSSARILRIKVVLNGIKPPVWRRLEVPADLTLDGLHRVLQAVFGWTDTHMHRFEIAGFFFAPPDLEGEADALNSRRQPLWALEGKVDRFGYTYDFGDDWRHHIVVEAWGVGEEGVQYPRCTGGARDCPPEDCGGVWGYEELLAALGDTAHARHQELKDWVGPQFNPDAFDLNRANAVLKNVRTPGHKTDPGPFAKAMAKLEDITLDDDDRKAAQEIVMRSLLETGMKSFRELEKALDLLTELRIRQMLRKRAHGGRGNADKVRRTGDQEGTI